MRGRLSEHFTGIPAHTYEFIEMNATFSVLGVPLLRLQHLNFQFSYNFATLFVSTNGGRTWDEFSV